MEKVFKIYKVYGFAGHRQGESFGSSLHFIDCNGALVSVCNSDITGTNEYAIVAITADSEEAVRNCLCGQLSDGVFENYRYGKVEEV